MAHTNRIDIVYNAGEAAASISMVNNVEGSIAGMVNLDAEERRKLPKMGELTRSFVSRTMEIAANNPQFVPPYLDLAAMGRDYNASVNLLSVEMQLASLLEKVSDSRILSGSEAYTAALMIYYSLKGAERSGVPGAGALYEELASRFPGYGGDEPLPEPPPV